MVIVFMNKIAFLLTITAISCDAFAVASISDFIMPDTNTPWQKTRMVNIHPYRKHAPLPQRTLHRHGLVDLETYGKLLLSYSKLANQFEIVTSKKTSESTRYFFRLNGIKVCDLEVALHSLPANRVYYVGKLPTGAPRLLRLNWPSIHTVHDLITASMPEANIITKSRCLLNTAAGLLPVYDVHIIADDLPYKLRITADRIIHRHRLFSHVKGRFKVYPENNVRSKKRVDTTVDVSGSGYLDNDYFTTHSHDEDIPRVYSEDNEFIYPEGDERMAEVNSFVHANQMLDWFIEMGFKPSQSDKVVIEVNPRDEDLSHSEVDIGNNAYYMPRQVSRDGTIDTKYARIFLSKGDGVILQNICNDSDVVAHELGHHIIYHYLANFNKDGGVLHEALADYFVYAKTNNACLAESICPNNSEACYVKGKCLRSAATDLTYRDVQASKSPHEKGMVLSSALWSLRSHSDTSKSEIDKVVYGSMDFFLPDTDQRGFIESMLVSDYKLFRGKHCKKIMSSMRRKGYGWHMDSLSCDNLAEMHDDRSRAKSESELRQGQDPYEYKKPTCGTILLSSNSSNYVLILLACAPLLIGWQQRRTRKSR